MENANAVAGKNGLSKEENLGSDIFNGSNMYFFAQAANDFFMFFCDLSKTYPIAYPASDALNLEREKYSFGAETGGICPAISNSSKADASEGTSASK